MGADDIERAEDVVFSVVTAAGANDLRIAELLSLASARLARPAAEVAARRALWNLVNAGKIQLTAARRFRATHAA